MSKQINRQIITFIGMSGVGKSYWSAKLKSQGYEVYPIDDLINLELESLISKTKGDENVKYENTAVGDLAKWMGFPGDKRYKANSKKYLKLESKITLQSIKNAIKKNTNAVIDTTGSVIYTDEKVQDFLKKNSKIVFFDTTEKNLNQMFKIFCDVPKPIIWGDIYKAKKGENEDEALKRYYKLLLNSRIKKYKKLAHTKIDYSWQRKNDRAVQHLLNKISK